MQSLSDTAAASELAGELTKTSNGPARTMDQFSMTLRRWTTCFIFSRGYGGHHGNLRLTTDNLRELTRTPKTTRQN